MDGIVGDTHSGKSLAIAKLAKYIHDTFGKKTRVNIGDGGVDTYNVDGGIDEGWIEIFDFSFRDYPQTVLKLMGDLYWPKDWRDNKSKLVPPSPNLFDEVGLIVYEGGTVIGNWLLSDIPGGLAWHAAQGTGFGGIKDDDGLLSFTDKFGGADNIADYQDQGINAPKHFMIAQRKILNAIRRTRQFPGQVIWTFHPTEGPDKSAGGESGEYGKITGKKIIGPDAGGKALASTLMKEFNNFLHFDQVTVVKDGEKDPVTQQKARVIEKKFRLYTRRHYDPDKVVLTTEYIAGTRAPWVKDYYESKEPGDSLLQFYQAVADGRKKATSTTNK